MFYVMFIPALLFYICFEYMPLWGLRMAFYEWGLFGPKYFKGFDNFVELLSSKLFLVSFVNTIIISGYNLIYGMLAAITFALLLNEIPNGVFKKFTQTIVYLPHFLSWVVVASIFAMLLSPDSGIVNEIIKHFGGKPIYFFISTRWWRTIFVLINLWKGTGWAAIIYLAALAGVDPQLYEAAAIDGAGRLRQTWHITLPAIQSTILVVFILNLAKILNIFHPVFLMYNPQVYPVADVIDTYTYRLGFTSASDVDLATAVGLFKSVICLILVVITNHLSKKIKGEKIL
ncbi:MAG: sugar ABC transporter permease [Firmicutes bacterium]|nr:sugar ABC transporter permease [Bacillota bacterium]